jgi:hypothetical protein
MFLHSAGAQEATVPPTRWRAEGYPIDDDAYTISYWPKTTGYSELLGVIVALRHAKFQSVQQFLKAHIGRADLSGRLICQFHGFNEEHAENPTLPTAEEFMEGRHYFATGDHSISFGTSFN